jgi:hypothetical protein
MLVVVSIQFNFLSNIVVIGVLLKDVIEKIGVIFVVLVSCQKLDLDFGKPEFVELVLEVTGNGSSSRI